MTIRPLDDNDPLITHGFTTDERQRCTGEAEMDQSQETRGLTLKTTCEIQLARTLEEGVYRWRVQALDASGSLRGEPSDWGFFVVDHR